MRRSLVVGALALAAGAAGCGGGRDGPAATTAAPLQVAVGPVQGARPLELYPAPAGRRVHVAFHRPPRAGLLFDLDTGEVLWARAPELRLPIASLTKMMTALVVVESEPPDAKVPITAAALDYTGSGIGELRVGQRVKLETLLNGLLLPSGNDAAIALALYVAGSKRAFVARMNQRAGQLGLRCTRYSTPSGVRDDGNRSCADDLAELARAVLGEPRLARIVRRRDVNLPFPIAGGRLWLHNNNPLLRTRYPGAIGIKTGYTTAAGMCLVAAAQRGGRRLGVVLLDSPNTGDQARKLLDRGFRVLR
ncbi:MAG TPA: serine hydrolase [Solirubrobacteraceae bacterium]|nr:serine hydrolase [Solirubrobacteraceae bacterium]